MQKIDEKSLEAGQLRRVWAVTEFCKRYRLDATEENRLRKLLGDFASHNELLMNAQRRPAFR